MINWVELLESFWLWGRASKGWSRASKFQVLLALPGLYCVLVIVGPCIIIIIITIIIAVVVVVVIIIIIIIIIIIFIIIITKSSFYNRFKRELKGW